MIGTVRHPHDVTNNPVPSENIPALYKMGNWLVGPADPCKWTGVTCNNGRVNTLHLDSSDLAGNIPPELGNLSELTELKLSENSLKGSIPAALGNLSKLQLLQLDNNLLTGAIPNLQQIPRRAENSLIGFNYLCVPNDTAVKTWLKTIGYSDGYFPPCNFCETGENTLPKEECEALFALYNSTNAKKGSLYNYDSDRGYQNWENALKKPQADHVTSLAFYDSYHPKTLPPELEKLTELESLYMDRHTLNGTIPSTLGKLTKLKTLSLGDNALTGRIPPQLGKLTNLTTLRLEENRLCGPVPVELGSLTQILKGNSGLFNNHLDVAGTPTDSVSLNAFLANDPYWDVSQTLR